MGRNERRTVGPRLSNAAWKTCCRKAEVRATCEDKGDALALLVTADKDCIDTALTAVERRAKDDLAAAYFIRAQRKGAPADFLHALNAAEELLRRKPGSPTARFNRALALEKLGLTREAILAWDDVVKLNERGWSDEARQRRERLLNIRDPEWRIDELEQALQQRDHATLTRIVRAFPSNAIHAFEESNLLDVETTRLFAEVLGDPYAQAILKASEQTSERNALKHGIRAFRQARTSAKNGQSGAAARAYQRASTLLEQAGSPLYLAARYSLAVQAFNNQQDSLPLLNDLAETAKKHAYHRLSARIETLRAVELDLQGRYLEAHTLYEQAIDSANGDPTATVAVLGRRSENYSTIGKPDLAFADSFRALALLSGVTDLNARHHAYGSAVTAARQLGYPAIALRYQNALVDSVQKTIVGAPAGRLAQAKLHLVVALRLRADLLIELGRDAHARADLEQASDLVEAIDKPEIRAQLKMRIKEVTAQASLKSDPKKAVSEFSEAIALAKAEGSTYRAGLHYKRAIARSSVNDPTAVEDFDQALKILREEAVNLIDRRKRGAYEALWTPYFSRFQAMHRDMIEERIAGNDIRGAFVYAEQVRGFEPMQLILQSQSAVPDFRKIETEDDLRRRLAALPEDTVILQYFVLEDRTYTWVLARNFIDLIQQRAGRPRIAAWVEEIGAAIRSGQQFDRAMRATYEELLRAPLALPSARRKTRIVIVPDGPMHGLPFAALQSGPEDYLIERGSIAVAGSTSLYLYALERDRQFPPNPKPSILVVANPTDDLPHARDEALELRDAYGDAKVLLGSEATVRNFLDAAKNSDIIHFAGHGVVNRQLPWLSKLQLARDGNDAGELTAETLMTQLSELERTRLVVLAACSSAGGVTVGPEGVAPLVRPLLAANVPAVIGTLWKINDATVKKLLVSLHCHYRNGDDVAVALQHAQLEMLRNEQEPARTWAAFQVVGYAGSPYARHAAMENTHSEHVCTQNSLHRPDGLHPQ
ncbi:MAG: CHAT domain-containing protein [Acidobacteriota bacterium]|nr:CHAT domain-containing protein [Acidobacteriota bacterium]